ncbi:MAG: beta-lactamase family protein, partial [Acidobacteriota bacterium]|nr:beta-lactamase family protein [Acidobacteriota bacterium]
MNFGRYFRVVSSLVLAFSILSMVFPGVAPAQSGIADQDLEKRLSGIEQKLEKRRKELGIPGVSLAIVKDGQVVLSKGYGYKDFENKTPMTTDTQLPIGSATKAFTALSVLILQDEGILTLDDNPRRHLSYFKINNPRTSEKIQIRDLLSHSSGLNRTDLAMITGKLDRKELIMVAGIAKPMAELRERFFYQNLMFTAAGEIVSEVSGMPWERFVPQRVFAPLGMNNSTMSVSEMQKSSDYSFGYIHNFDTKETRKLPTRNIDAVAPAGSINSSANDMAKWIKFILSGGKIGDQRFLSAESFAEWIKPQMKITPDGKVSYGLGWFVQEWKDKKVIQHGGNIDGFNSMVAMMPEENLGFVLLTNVSASSLGGEMMQIIWSGLLDEESKDEIAGPEQQKEVGKYNFPQAGFDIEVLIEDGKLVAKVPQQPTYALKKIEGRRYALSNAPPGFFITFKNSEAVLEQPNGKFTLTKRGAEPDAQPVETGAVKTAEPKAADGVEKSEFTASELVAKVVEALGGEKNLRKITSRKAEFRINAVNQGVMGYGKSYSKAPGRSYAETTLTALGKKIGWTRDYYDGTTGGSNYSFSDPEVVTGKRLRDVAFGYDFYPFLNLEDKVDSMEAAKTKNEGQTVYTLTLHPKEASRVVYYISADTFLPVKRLSVVVSSSSSVQIPVSESYSDYRRKDGTMIPFKIIGNSPTMGDIITTIRKLKHNVRIKDDI